MMSYLGDEVHEAREVDRAGRVRVGELADERLRHRRVGVAHARLLEQREQLVGLERAVAVDVVAARRARGSPARGRG